MDHFRSGSLSNHRAGPCSFAGLGAVSSAADLKITQANIPRARIHLERISLSHPVRPGCLRCLPG